MSKRTFAELLDVSIKRAVARGCEPATIKSYEYQVRRFLLPALGHKKLTKLKPEHFERLYADMLAQGISTSTIRKAHCTAGIALKHAERKEWVRTNAARLAELPKHVPLAKNWPTTEELHRFLEVAAMRDPDIFDFASIIAGTGIRPGEACALMQADLDADRILTIERALDVCRGHARIKCTKTGKSRRFAIDTHTADIIRRRPSPYLFGGHEPERTDLMSKRFKRCAKKAKVNFTPRNLRHYYATTLIAADVDIKTVADRLGHANPNTTWAFYVGSVPVKQTIAADVIASRLYVTEGDRT